jgi:hypothetical protein
MKKKMDDAATPTLCPTNHLSWTNTFLHQSKNPDETEITPFVRRLAKYIISIETGLEEKTDDERKTGAGGAQRPLGWSQPHLCAEAFQTTH